MGCLLTGSRTIGFGRESAAAADLDVNVESGAFDESVVLATAFCGFFGLVNRAAIVFWYLSSAALLFPILVVHSFSIHSGSCIQGILVLSKSRRRRASAFLSAISASLRRLFSSRVIKLRPSSPILVAKCCK